MYLSILGKPTDKDLERYPAVHLTGPHEWDPSVLDYTHPSGDGEPPWSNDPDERSAFDPNFDEFCDYTQRAIQALSILDDSSSTFAPCPTFMANQHEFRTYQHAVNHEAPDYEKFRPFNIPRRHEAVATMPTFDPSVTEFQPQRALSNPNPNG